MSNVQLASQVFSLYRKHLREIRKLPHLYLQQFYRVKTRNDARALLAPSATPHLSSRFRNGYKILRKLQSANSGGVKAFNQILTLAYGRRGKLKWELLEPLLTDPNAPPPPPIIPKVANSRPPVYPKPLLALLTNSQSMATRPLKKDAWTKEELIGPRIDPHSEEAHIFGPFPKRREYNVQWRFFRTETKKVLPPVEITVATRKDRENGDEKGVQRPHYTEIMPLQNLGLVSEVEKLVGGSVPAPLTRRERKVKAASLDSETTPPSLSTTRHPSRWVRRRYRELLTKLPILTYMPKYNAKEGEEGSYTVRLSDHAAGKSPAADVTVREIDETNLAWLMHQGMGRGSHANSTQKAKRRS